jgi:uncharacterized protein YbjT (DUF2867 family)
MNADVRKILVLGASGLIGGFVTSDLRVRGFRVVGVARKLPASQKRGALDLELPVMSMEAAQLARLLRDHHIDVVVNCLGVLQDGPGRACDEGCVVAAMRHQHEEGDTGAGAENDDGAEHVQVFDEEI